ncbi:MAG: phosphoadenosine phosphosulfate reductase family protein [Methanobrevibacter sp.]|nr:phosphoadenosine phosphosulfate reductase family protein [Methanobrevibacter sp.]
MNNMLDYELTLFDRINVIRDTIKKYGEENFYISFSGGKDSTILHHLIDMAIPENKIPRVFINTGIEYKAIVDFVQSLAENDPRIVMVKPSRPIIKVLEEYGYPFKSKEHSCKLHEWQLGHHAPSIISYRDKERYGCPKILKYQFEEGFNMNISHFCCHKLKKEPAKKWQKENHKSIVITGMMRAEGGQRNTLSCILTNRSGKVIKFHPLAVIDKEWEDEFIQRNNIQLCSLYYPPFNFKRTGCKGCPFALKLQEQLDIMEELLPTEKAQCEIIWKPVYDEYRRIGYRLKKENS